MSQDSEHNGTPTELREGAESFYARGERGWQEYLRTGAAISTDQVAARVDAVVAAHRERLLRESRGNLS